MTASTRREVRSAATSTSTTAIDLIRPLTDARPIKPTSARCLSARRPNPGRGSTYRRGNSVQTAAATSTGWVKLSQIPDLHGFEDRNIRDFELGAAPLAQQLRGNRDLPELEGPGNGIH